MSSADLARLEAIVDSSGVPERIEALLPVGVRPRQLSVRSLLLGILICLADQRPAHLVRIHEALIALDDAEQRRLGVIVSFKTGPHPLTYRQTEYTFARVVKALAKENPDGEPSQILCEIIDSLIEASVKVAGVPDSSSYAIDWSDYESFARPPRRKRALKQESHASQPQGEESGKPQTASNQKDSADRDPEDEDEPSRCADLEAAWGHRKTNHPGKNELFFGYYLQAATIVKDEGGPEVPELVRAITLASCKHDPPAQITPVIQRMAAEAIKLGDLIADSGYSYREPQTFAIPARATGARLVIDLHPNDRGMNGTHEGAGLCNGNLYCPATPKSLLALSPLPPGASEEQTATHDRQCEELARYKLSPLSAPDADGYHRVICPAAAGKLRCPHKPASMSLSHERPTITEPPQHLPTCCSQQTITVPPSVNAKTAQKHDWPSAEHRRSYARRTAAERTFSRLYDPAATDISRGWSRLMGLTPNAIMLACATIIANIATANACAARRAEDERRAACGLPPRRRRRRRQTIHELARPSAHAPPAIAA